MMGLLRAVGGAASWTLGSVWPLRWPAFPVSFLDFEMFNEPADALYAATAEKVAAAGAEKRAAEQEPLPDFVDTYARCLAAVLTGDLGMALSLADQFATEFSQVLADLLGVDLNGFQSSVVGFEGPAQVSPAADGPVSESPPQDDPPAGTGPPTSSEISEECPASAVRGQAVSRVSPSLDDRLLGGASDSRTQNPSGAGHPTLTVGELEDAAYAVRRHVDRISSDIGTDAWTHLAEKLEAAAAVVSR